MNARQRTKIVLIGSGSMIFSRNLIADILWHESLKDSEICLVDTDKDRLATSEAMARIIAGQIPSAKPVIKASSDRKKLLEGADFVISCIGVGGFDATEKDLSIPAKHGLIQTVGDTLGIGGIFRSMRSIPELLRICEDMKELCPDALLLNYSNPMAMHCLAVERATKIRHVGLCHGVQNTAQSMRMYVAMLRDSSPEEIRRHFERPFNSPERNNEWATWCAKGDDPELNYTCAGINHMAFFLDFNSGKKDLYPDLKRALKIPHIHRLDPVRFELFSRLGYFMTETSGHISEYLPYFLKDKSEIGKNYLVPLSYIDTCRCLDKEYIRLRKSILDGRPVVSEPYKPSKEFASRIIDAAVTGRAFVFNGNVHNQGGLLISNLPGDCCVEVPCVSDRQGIRPVAVGELPPQCAALIRTNINVQDLAVRGILEEDPAHIRHAAMLDPNTSSQLSLSQIDRLLEDLFKAHSKLLPKTFKGFRYA